MTSNKTFRSNVLLRRGENGVAAGDELVNHPLRTMSVTLVIDPQAIENLRALNPGDNDEFLREITEIFLEDTPQRISELNQGLAAGDVSKFTRAAHSIKGSAANLGAAALRAVAEKLEHQSRTDGLAGVAPLVVEIKTEFSRAETELRKILAPK